MTRNELIQSITQTMGLLWRAGAGRPSQTPWPKHLPTRAQLGIMLVLLQQGGQGIKELAAHFGMSSSAVTQLVNSMVTEGLLVRTEDTRDRRHVHLGLTVAGKKKLVAAKSARLKQMAQLFEPLSDAELAQFLALQQKIADHFQRACPKK